MLASRVDRIQYNEHFQTKAGRVKTSEFYSTNVKFCFVTLVNEALRRISSKNTFMLLILE